jgi:hypothetical protein
MCITYTIGSAEFQKLEYLGTNAEISLGEGALPRVRMLVYTASAGRKDSLTLWINNCPLLRYVGCQVDCANSGRMEVKSAKAALRKAKKTHPNAKDLCLGTYTQNYNRKAAQAGNSTHGYVCPWAPDPNGQGMGINVCPWVRPMGDPISCGSGMGMSLRPWVARWATRLILQLK